MEGSLIKFILMKSFNISIALLTFLIKSYLTIKVPKTKYRFRTPQWPLQWNPWSWSFFRRFTVLPSKLRWPLDHTCRANPKYSLKYHESFSDFVVGWGVLLEIAFEVYKFVSQLFVQPAQEAEEVVFINFHSNSISKLM